MNKKHDDAKSAFLQFMQFNINNVKGEEKIADLLRVVSKEVSRGTKYLQNGKQIDPKTTHKGKNKNPTPDAVETLTQEYRINFPSPAQVWAAQKRGITEQMNAFEKWKQMDAFALSQSIETTPTKPSTAEEILEQCKQWLSPASLLARAKAYDAEMQMIKKEFHRHFTRRTGLHHNFITEFFDRELHKKCGVCKTDNLMPGEGI